MKSESELKAGSSRLDGLTSFRAWLGAVAFPFWAERGQLRPGVFVERLDAEGRPDTGTSRRVRMQARQTFSFATAAVKGWADTADIALAGGHHLLTVCSDPDRPGKFFRRVEPDGRVSEAGSDLYEQACAILAFSALYQLTGDTPWRDAAFAAVEYVETALGHPAGGYREGDPDRLPRRQNPHMHMMESYLALYDACGAPGALDGAARMSELFRDRFFDARAGLLLEYFDDDLRPLEAKDGGRVEPGHEMEWVWLLRAWAERGGCVEDGAITALFRHALDAGLNPRSGLLYNVVDRDNAVIGPQARLWPQTERVKAEFAQARAGIHDAAAAITELERVHGTFLTEAAEGHWYDLVDAEGHRVPGPVPASALYHLTTMMLEIERFIVEQDKG